MKIKFFYFKRGRIIVYLTNKKKSSIIELQFNCNSILSNDKKNKKKDVQKPNIPNPCISNFFMTC